MPKRMSSLIFQIENLGMFEGACPDKTEAVYVSMC